MTAQQYGFNWDATWLEQTVTPATPDTGKWKIFPKSDGFYQLDDLGTATKFATGGGGVQFGLTSTATAAGTTTLTSASNPIQLFTGATTQNCVLPDATTLIVGWFFVIRNTSSGIVTVKDGGAGATIVALGANQEVTLYCSSIGSAAGTWSQQVVTGTGAYVLATSPTLVTPVLGVASATSLTTTGHVGVAVAVSSTSALAISETTADPGAQVQGLGITETATLSSNSALTPVVQGGSFGVTLNIGSSNATGAAPGGVRAFNATATVTGTSGTATFATGLRAQVLISGGITLTGGTAILVATPTNSASTMTGMAGMIIAAQTSATSNTYLLLNSTAIPSGNFGIYSATSNPSTLLGNLAVGRNSTALAPLDAQISDSGTTTVVEAAAFVRNSSGTPAAGLGGDIGLYLKSSTTADTLAGRLRWYWNTATHASRKAYATWSAYDTAERDVIGIGASGSASLLGFFPTIAAAPVVQQVDGAALTNNVTSGGTTDTIANYTDLTIYANDAAAIRNDIYQLARKLKIVDDALRAYGLLT